MSEDIVRCCSFARVLMFHADAKWKYTKWVHSINGFHHFHSMLLPNKHITLRAPNEWALQWVISIIHHG